MIKTDFLGKLSGFFIFYRWHPEVALRYLPIVERIKKQGNKTTICEVGSGGLGIAPYIKRHVIGVDVSFVPPYHPDLERIRYDGKKIPYPNNTFDFVLSVDTLEHMPNEFRENQIDELLRIAKKEVIIAVPSGKLSEIQDQQLDEEYKKVHGKNFMFHEDHLKYGLPSIEQIQENLRIAAKKQRKKVTSIVKGNETLRLHKFLMKGWIKQGLLSNIVYRKFLLFLLPILKKLNKEPTYRKIIYVTIQQ